MIEVVVDSRLRLRLDSLSEELLESLKTKFEYSNPAFFKARALGKSTWNVPKKISTWREEDGEVSFPRGGLARVREAIARCGERRRVVDLREDGTVRTDLAHSFPGGNDPWPSQTAAIDALYERANCLLRSPTGGGKTSVACALAARVGLATLVLVDSTALAEQWRVRAVDELGLDGSEIGTLCGGKFDLRPLTIGMPASVVTKKGNDRERMLRYFGAVFFDEVHGAAARRAYEAVDFFPARYRVGFSADHRRKDGLEFLVEDLFGEVAYSIDREQLVEDGVILDVEVRVIPTDFEAPWYDAGGPRAEDDDEERESDFNRLLDEMAADPARERLAEEVMVEVAGIGGEQLLVLAHRREHCRSLHRACIERSIPAGFLIGGTDYASEFRETRAALVAGTKRVGVGTIRSIGQGIDLPAVGHGLVATPLLANQQKFNQARGRFCRKPGGKTEAVLYYLWDRKVFGLRHLANAVRWNPTVLVREPDGSWTRGKDYLRVARAAAKEGR